jgi:hypothetical protein
MIGQTITPSWWDPSCKLQNSNTAPGIRLPTVFLLRAGDITDHALLPLRESAARGGD